MMKSARVIIMVGCLTTLTLYQEPLGAEECSMENRACVVESLRSAADRIENVSWRDQTYRELAKTMAFDGDVDGAISYIGKIQSPDTKAMTIRGIGMAAADNKLSKEAYDDVFKKLRDEAEKITDPPSYAIALTYIAMAQAFAGLDEKAWATAASMKNDALRHKAYGETAEIQAERGDFNATMKSTDLIGSPSYRDKEYVIVSKIFADKKMFEESLRVAQKISNAYEKASALQFALDAQKPREVEKK